MISSLRTATVYLCALVTLAAASLYPTMPVQATVWDSQKPQTIRWRGTKQDPPLQLMGKIEISLWTGGIEQQTFLTCLSCGRYIDATRNSSVIKFDDSVGPSGHFYFLRFDAPDSLDEPIYTGRFTLENMTGKFNSTVLVQLATLNATSSGNNSPANATVAVNSASFSIVPSSTQPNMNATATPIQNNADTSFAFSLSPFSIFTFLALAGSAFLSL